MAMPVRRVDAPRRRSAAAIVTGRVAAPRARTAAPSAPHLRVVPRPRTAVNAVIVLVVVVVALMLAAVMLHTRLAERQLEIDRLEQEVTQARERFDVLRQQRAELRAPTRLAVASADLGLIATASTEFLPIDGRTFAEVIASAGTLDDLTETVDPPDPLDQVSRVKAAGGD